MSIQLKFTATKPDESAGINLQYIPARTHTKLEEETNIKQFFDTYSDAVCESDSAQIGPPIANSLRGYPVIGQAMQIPPTHVGLVFQEDKQPLDEDAQRTFQQKCSFSRFTYWNYDQNPSANDTLRKAVENLGMIDELHQSVDSAELDRFIQKHSANTKNDIVQTDPVPAGEPIA